MVTRDDVLSHAVNECMKELYSVAQPSVEWDDFRKQCEDYTKKYNEWESMDRDSRPNIHEFCGPRPYEFYYVPSEYMNLVCESYVRAYRIGSQSELNDTVQILKDYLKSPIVDKYIDEYTDESGQWHPGYKSYDHPNNLKERIGEILRLKCQLNESRGNSLSDELCGIVDEMLDMATGFYNWNRELGSFNMSVYLGASPCSNKKTVIDNWKEYRGADITIDDDLYKDEDEYEDDDYEKVGEEE